MKEHDFDLLNRYLDGVLTAEELEPLEQLLRSSEEARAVLRSLATIDTKWQQLAADHAVVISKDQSHASEHGRRAISAWLMLCTIAASLIVAAFGWFRTPDITSTATKIGVARVIRIEGDGKAGQGRSVADGAELFAGEELAMEQGLIELAFRETGVHIIATAPLKLTLDSYQRVSLHEGQVKLVVPPQGIGFVVDTAQRKFVDLGTSFVVTANRNGSEVLVLDGQISVDQHDGTSQDLMREGEFASFYRNGKIDKRSPTSLSRELPELDLQFTNPIAGSLRGVSFGYKHASVITKANLNEDMIGRELFPLIKSGFQDRACLKKLQKSEPIRFRGIAGAYHKFPIRTGLNPYSADGGWMSWYHGKVSPPRAGRFRFWGYADNHLMVAIDGKPVFEGSRRDSPLKELGVPRTNNPALPCMIARAGFACSNWFELSGDPIQLDILFGEVGGNITSGLLLVEQEGISYEETFWGQPKWPLFLTEAPAEDQTAEFQRLVNHLENRMMGSFSISQDAVWKLAE